MGYYRGEYEEYYRNIKMSNGRSRYNKAGNYSRGTGGYSRERNVRGNRNNKQNKTGRNHIYDIFKMLGIQTLGICSIGALVYVCGMTEEAKFVEIKDTIVQIIKEDYYFGEDKFIAKMKAKIDDISIVEGIEGEKKGEQEQEKKEDEKVESENIIKLKDLNMIMPTIGEEKILDDGKMQIKGEKDIFSAKGGEITYVKDGKVIINHGGKVETVYEKIASVEVKKGQKVDVSERIGKNNKNNDGIIFYVLKNGEVQSISK